MIRKQKILTIQLRTVRYMMIREGLTNNWQFSLACFISLNVAVVENRWTGGSGYKGWCLQSSSAGGVRMYA